MRRIGRHIQLRSLLVAFANFSLTLVNVLCCSQAKWEWSRHEGQPDSPGSWYIPRSTTNIDRGSCRPLGQEVSSEDSAIHRSVLLLTPKTMTVALFMPLIVSRDSFSHQTWVSLPDGRSIAYPNWMSLYVGHPISSATSLITWKRKMDHSSNIVIYLL